MVDWKLYVHRGIISSGGSFDSSQIAAGLDIDVLPQIVLPIGIEDMSVLDKLYGYLSGEGLSDIPLKITGHDKKPFNSENSQKIIGIFDNIHRLNAGYDEKIITDVISTAGAVHSIPDELGLRETESKGYGGVSATFTAKDYYCHISSVRMNMLGVFNEANKLDIPFIIGNSACIDYGFTKDVDSKSDILKSDPRWGKTGWLPERLQTGDVGCAHDLAYLTELERPVCINIEDLNQTIEYSHEFNLHGGGVVDKIGVVSENEQFVLDEGLGVFVRQGCPIYYEKPVNPIDVINTYTDQIPICEIGGQASMFYDDEGITKIGSHMPITFGNDPNEYISDDVVRLDQNKKREVLLTGNLKALHGAGCRKGVLNLYLGPDVYTGSKWREYHELSRDNVLSITDKF
ncbi:MAG: hypothetical protein KAI18_02370 [Candidatus Aenigmarchaeota archaeon]|nr:hypothetical protein [Candidatus Aenigmarchaeota archaeon]